MLTRTTKKTVTFGRPFILGGFDEVLPAGTYDVETDEELVPGISFPVYRSTVTHLRLHTVPGQATLSETLTIDPNELEAALRRDRTTLETAVRPKG